MDAWQVYLSQHNGKPPRNAFDLLNFTQSTDIELTYKEAKQLYQYNNIGELSNDNDNDSTQDVNDNNDKWECNNCSYLNRAAMTYCEQCDCSKPVENDENVPLQPKLQHIEPGNNRSDQYETWRIIIIIVICIACIVVIIVVRFVIIDGDDNVYSDIEEDYTCDVCEEDCTCDFYKRTYESTKGVCGKKTNNSVPEAYCPFQCMKSIDPYYRNCLEIYFVRNTGKCYCYVPGYKYCFGFNDNDLDVQKWEAQCSEIFGRPYNIDDDAVDLKSNIKYIGCNDYRYYDNIEWIEFVLNNNRDNNSFIDYDEMNKWKNRGLSEHAAIATFNKFSLELMSIGAPLWFIKLSNDASLDEIKHSEISFDIANMYLNNINDDNYCMLPDKFPNHIVNIDRDWNVISKDTAIGGCIGETISIFKLINDNKYNNMIDKYLYEIAMEEINHSALAWTTIKWMIHNSPKNINLDIKNNNWWKKQIIDKKQLLLLSNNNHLLYVYDEIIPSILNKILISTNYTYKQLYKSIIHKLQYELNTKVQMTCLI